MKSFLLPAVQIALFTFIILSGQLFAKNIILFPLQVFGIYLIVSTFFKKSKKKSTSGLNTYITRPVVTGFAIIVFALIFDLYTEERLLVGILFLATFFFTQEKRKKSKRK